MNTSLSRALERMRENPEHDQAGETTPESPGSYPAGSMYGDARVCGTAAYVPDYAKEMIVSLGGSSRAKNWKPLHTTPGDFNDMLSRHRPGNKDGKAFVLGDMASPQRLKNSMRALYGVALDIDTGVPSAVVDAPLAEMGCQAVRYSTHSHNKTESDFSRDDVLEFAQGRPIDTALLREFVAETRRWDSAIASRTEFVRDDRHTHEGIRVVVSHPRMPKHRVVILFQEPFVIAKEGASQKEALAKWEKVPEALANLLGVPLDKSCRDASRLFYFPRHAKDREFEISLFGGPYFDWRTLALDNPLERVASGLGGGESKSVTEEGRKLGRWAYDRARGFQIVDVIHQFASDRIRHDKGSKIEIECPFDANHSNAGAPEDCACFAVNAGDGLGDFFTISCRHESCHDKTMLDMLGKMLADGWFERDVLENENYNAAILEGDSPEADRGQDSADGPALTPQTVESKIREFGGKPSAADLKALLDQIAAVKDDGLRDLLFDTARDAVTGKRKETVARARSQAAKKWKAENNGSKGAAKAKGKEAESKIALPPWGSGCYFDPELKRAYVWGSDSGGNDLPLHTPLRLCADMTYVDTLEAGKECQGVCIEFEDKGGKPVRRSFTRGQALAHRNSEGSIIKHLSNSGVGFTTAGMERVESAVLASGKSETAGKVYGTPGVRGDSFFLHADGTVIGTPGHYVELESPIPLERSGTLDGWCKANAVAFSPDVIAMRPHIPATIMWSFTSPVIDLVKADGLVLALVGPTRSYKTFAFKCAASGWGSVTDKGRGVIHSFNSTTNRLEADVASLSGHAFFADDTSQIKAHVMGQTVCDFVFRITGNGKRGRLGEDHQTFRLAAAISSESRLAELMRLSSYEAPRGLMSRVLEVSTGEAVPDKEHPDATGQPVPDDLVKAMMESWRNAGHAGPAFVQAMFAGGWTREKIEDAVDSHVRDLNGKSEQERSASRAVAFLLVAGTIAQEAKLIPVEFDLRAFALKLWQESRGANDTSGEMSVRVYEALHREFMSGYVTIYDERRERVIKARGGLGIELHTEFKHTNKDKVICFTPAFVVPKSALQKIGGLREAPKAIASAIKRDGYLIPERPGKLAWREESRIGVEAYVIDARAVFGDDCDPKIELHTKSLAGETLAEQITAGLVEALEDHTARRAKVIEPPMN